MAREGAATPALDREFLRRVYFASLGLTLLFGLGTAVRVDPRFGLALTLSGLWSTANLWVLERLLRAAVRPTGRDTRTVVWAAVVKIPVLYGLLVLLLAQGMSPLAVLIGLSLPLLVVGLKAFGRAFFAGRGPAAAPVDRSADHLT